MRREINIGPRSKWVDVWAPTKVDLNAVAAEFSLPSHLLQDCLDPRHLPKVEQFPDSYFVIFRAFDETAKSHATTIRGISHKFAIFGRADLLLTIHRSPMKIIDDLFDHQHESLPKLFLNLGKRSALSFELPLEIAEQQLEQLENKRTMKKLHDLRGRLSSIKRLLWHTLTILQRGPWGVELRTTDLQDIRETVEGLMFFSDELLDDANHLMQLEISLSSQRTNEVMRVLTIFSVFFMPLTFIVGVYGMNFHFMPELGSKWGYPAVWFVMVGITVTIALWFRHKKWL